MQKYYQTISLGIMIHLLSTIGLYAQDLATIRGKILDNTQKPLAYASIQLEGTSKGTISQEDGTFQIEAVPAGTYTLIISAIGFKTERRELALKPGQHLESNYTLSADLLQLEQIVVSSNRSEVPLQDAPVLLSRLNSRSFEQAQALSLSEGLHFSPGLRLENNCQNCGFTQVRMNGLEGAYSQILINSRPIFSSLMGVYGLELFPSNMIERVEIVRGGGSALYGGNAIAGTINIITKDPLKNSFEVGSNYSLIDGKAPDLSFRANATLVSDDLDKGISMYAFNRKRTAWDANGDEFSEITELRNSTFGFDTFWNTSDLSKLKLNFFNINEYRRGGNDFDLEPHQSDIAEQISHQILGSTLSYEQFLPNKRHKFSLYAALQSTQRDSYYGAGGRVIPAGEAFTEDDLIALNAYGNSQDLSLTQGLQYSFEISEIYSLIAGSEYQFNRVKDRMPGYRRAITQQVATLGSYAQLEIRPSERLSFLLSGRYDYLNIEGQYDLEAENLENNRKIGVFVPRITMMYRLLPDLKLRVAAAQGYRAPQAFDEDLHIETVGGAARFTRLSPELEIERSNSISTSLNYSKGFGNTQFNFVLEGFYTHLQNPFILSNPEELPSGIAVITKRNGEGAKVQGLNLEANMAWQNGLSLDAGLTWQQARFEQAEEIWTPAKLSEQNQDSLVSTRNLLRTPDVYGFWAVNYNWQNKLSLSYTGLMTGAMDVAHMIEPSTEFTQIKRTPFFAEHHLRFAYRFDLKDRSFLKLSAGVQNIFGAYQQDFDFGIDRDAGYVYGPLRPRTFFLGLNFGID